MSVVNDRLREDSTAREDGCERIRVFATQAIKIGQQLLMPYGDPVALVEYKTPLPDRSAPTKEEKVDMDDIIDEEATDLDEQGAGDDETPEADTDSRSTTKAGTTTNEDDDAVSKKRRRSTSIASAATKKSKAAPKTGVKAKAAPKTGAKAAVKTGSSPKKKASDRKSTV